MAKRRLKDRNIRGGILGKECILKVLLEHTPRRGREIERRLARLVTTRVTTSPFMKTWRKPLVIIGMRAGDLTVRSALS